MSQWIGVDLDGTLAKYDGWQGIDNIGEPIKPMIDRVKRWLENGHTVKIMTARVNSNQDKKKIEQARYWIEAWCLNHIGQKLEVTSEKDFEMAELWDDRAVSVVFNTGMPYPEY